MNLRLLLIIFIILVFTLEFGILSYQVSGGTTLKQASDAGKIEVVQNTTPGTVPHLVNIKNKDDKSVKVEKGDLLTSATSQDLVIAENTNIPSNSSELIKTYCIEPSQMSYIGAKLSPGNKTSKSIIQIIESSDPSNFQNAMKAQLQIWVITGGNVNLYTGEARELVNTQNITFTQLRHNISDSKIDVMARFNVTSEGIKNLNQNQNGSILGTFQEWIDNTIQWIKESLRL